jgi:hypothetical protein
MYKYTLKAWDQCYDLKNIFAKKFGEKKAFLTQNKANICKNFIITLVFEENANFFAENCRKWQKIVIITSTPGQQNLTNLLLKSLTNKHT